MNVYGFLKKGHISINISRIIKLFGFWVGFELGYFKNGGASITIFSPILCKSDKILYLKVLQIYKFSLTISFDWTVYDNE